MGRELNGCRAVRRVATGWRGTLLFTLVALSGCEVGDGGPEDRNAQGAAAEWQASRPYRAMLYSEPFGLRFGLPASGVQPLDPGLQAIGIEIALHDDGLLVCRMLLYVDSDLDIAYAGAGAGDRYDLYDGRRDLFFVETLSDPDFEYLEEKLARYANLILFRSSELSWEREQGFFEGALIDRYSTPLLPGTAMLAFGFTCSDLDPAAGTAEVWVLKSGSRDYVIQYDTFDEQHLYRFRLPERLQHAAWPQAVRAMEFNDRARPTLSGGRDSAELNFEIPPPLRQ